MPTVVGKEGVLDRVSSNCKGLEEKDEEREMYLKCKTKNQTHIGLEIGQRAVARRGWGVWPKPSSKTCDPRPRGYLECAGNTGGCSEVSRQSDLYQEGSMRRQSQWEARESNSLGGFPRRRKDLGHWDLVTGQAGTWRTLGRTQN